MSAFNEERVLSVHHWTDRPFSFTTTRGPSPQFSNGHFTMIGLRTNDKPLLRANGTISANHEDHLDLLSMKVPDGPLSSRRPGRGPTQDRAMICGSPALLRDLKALPKARGSKKGSASKPGCFVIERAFVEP